MILQCALLFLFLALGELIVWLTGTSIPSSIIGMLLLAAALQLKVVKPAQIEQFADFLTHNIGFFFVPAGVGVMNCMGLISGELLPIVVATIGSTIIIIAVTGQTYQLTRRWRF